MLWNNFVVFSKDMIIPFFIKFGVPVLQWGGWILLGSALLFIFHQGDKVDKWIARIEGWLVRRGFGKERSYITRDIRSRINIASKKINKEAEGTVTKGIEIVWVDDEHIESFLRKGKVVIRMRQHENQDRNIANATEHYVKRGVLHTGKRYLNNSIRDALDLSLTKKILSEEAEDGTALEFFSTNRLDPNLRGDRVLNETFSTIEQMEDKGLLTRVLLREIRLLGKRLYPQMVSDQILSETTAFFTFLMPFASHRGGGDDIHEWQFRRNNIQVGILYVARQEKIDIEGLVPYQNRLEQNIRLGCRRIYVFGRRENNVKAVEELTYLIQKQVPGIKVHREYYSEIRGEKIPAVCAVVSV